MNEHKPPQRGRMGAAGLACLSVGALCLLLALPALLHSGLSHWQWIQVLAALGIILALLGREVYGRWNDRRRKAKPDETDVQRAQKAARGEHLFMAIVSGLVLALSVVQMVVQIRADGYIDWWIFLQCSIIAGFLVYAVHSLWTERE